eukprot:3028554-Amphidinium_carterae.1
MQCALICGIYKNLHIHANTNCPCISAMLKNLARAWFEGCNPTEVNKGCVVRRSIFEYKNTLLICIYSYRRELTLVLRYQTVAWASQDSISPFLTFVGVTVKALILPLRILSVKTLAPSARSAWRSH